MVVRQLFSSGAVCGGFGSMRGAAWREGGWLLLRAKLVVAVTPYNFRLSHVLWLLLQTRLNAGLSLRIIHNHGQRGHVFLTVTCALE